MANFNLAFDRTMKHEGIYSNDPDDAGKETCFGISRKYHPDWIGWKIVDSYSKSINEKALSKALQNDSELKPLVKDFYKKNFWDCFELDKCKSDATASIIFDTAVNLGKVRAIKLAQKVLGVKETGRWSIKLLNELVK